MFNDSLTIYNYYRDSSNGNVEWYRTQLKGLMWTEKTQTSVSADRHINIAQMVSVTIPLQKLTCDKEYISSVEWQNLDDKSAYWTVNTKGQDVIVKGLIDKELSQDYPSTNLKKDYESVATVISFADNTSRDKLKHYRIGGK